MLKKLLLLAAVLIVAMAGPAGAGDGYSDEDALVLSDSTVAPGGPLTLTAKVCEPAATATFTLGGSQLGTAAANQAGEATLSTTVPSNLAAGTYPVQSSCLGPDGQTLVLNSTLTVTGAAGAGTGSGDLPTTGSSSTTPMTQIAVAALAAGGLLVLVANKRRGAKPTERQSLGV